MFKKLVKDDGYPIWINLNHVVCVNRLAVYTAIDFTDGEQLLVKETPEEIIPIYCLAKTGPIPC